MGFKIVRPVRVDQRRSCIISGCNNRIYARGLCKCHYNRARYFVQEKLTTWDGLVASKQALPKQRADKLDRKQLQKAILALHQAGEYPSVTRICQEIGRKSRILRGKECKWRDEIFEELGIVIKTRGSDITLT